MTYAATEKQDHAEIRATSPSKQKTLSESVKAFAKACGTQPMTGNRSINIRIEAESLDKTLYELLHKAYINQKTKNILVTGFECTQLSDLQTDGWRLEGKIEVKRVLPEREHTNHRPRIKHTEVGYSDEWVATSKVEPQSQ
jgi:SHS2 domain-containing protein